MHGLRSGAMGHISIEIQGELAKGLTALDVARAIQQVAERLCAEVQRIDYVRHDGTAEASGPDAEHVRWTYWPERAAEVRERHQASDN